MSRMVPCLLFVGAFPSKGSTVLGGNVVDCRTLLGAGFGQGFELLLLDSTQRSVPSPGLLVRLALSVPRLLKYLLKVVGQRPDAILLFSSGGASFLEKCLMCGIGRLAGARVLYFPRGGRLMEDCRSRDWYRRLVGLLMRIPDVILCQGAVWRDFFVTEVGVPEECCSIVPNWTATSELVEIGEERTYPARNDLKILFLGWLESGKGVFELIEAFALTRERFPELELWMAGYGGEAERLRGLVKSRRLESAVKFLGWVDGKVKNEIMAEADLFCLPSHTEGLPNALIEAMTVGLPVLVTPVGSIPDVIQDGRNGLLTPVRDEVALAKLLGRLVSDRDLRERLGREAHLSAVLNFSPSQAVDKLTRLALGGN